MELLRREAPESIRTEPRHQKVLVDVYRAMEVLPLESRRRELFSMLWRYLAVVAKAKPSKQELLWRGRTHEWTRMNTKL